MERLWAPWRMPYITGEHRVGGCVFCTILSEQRDEEHRILLRGQTCFVIMNLFPYTGGHLMVVPVRHVADISDLEPPEQVELLQLAGRCTTAIRSRMKAEGFNLGINIGKTAGAGVLDHLHLHIVPRWNGDTNFMPVLGETRVISEALDDTYSKLKGVI